MQNSNIKTKFLKIFHTIYMLHYMLVPVYKAIFIKLQNPNDEIFQLFKFLAPRAYTVWNSVSTFGLFSMFNLLIPLHFFITFVYPFSFNTHNSLALFFFIINNIFINFRYL